MPSYTEVGYRLFEDDVEFVSVCKCDKCQKKVRPDLRYMKLPPSETTSYELDAMILSRNVDVHGYVVRHFLPMLDEAVLSVNWSRVDVTYDISSVDLGTSGRLLFDARRVYRDEVKEVVWDEAMDMMCPCSRVYKDFGVAGHVSCDHPKYQTDEEGNIYVCNGYLHAFAMQFNKKLAYMANMKVRLARSKENERVVGRLQKALDKKKTEVRALLDMHKGERAAFVEEKSRLDELLKKANDDLKKAREHIRKLETTLSKERTKTVTAVESRALLERQVAGCRRCGTSFTSGSFGACMGGCQHVFCIDCGKNIISGDCDEPSDFIDPLHPTRVYAPSAIKPVCPECEFPSEFVSTIEF